MRQAPPPNRSSTALPLSGEAPIARVRPPEVPQRTETRQNVGARRRRADLLPGDGAHALHVVPWSDPVVDDHGVAACSRYVELYWLAILGPSTTWLLRRLSYGLALHTGGFDLPLAETARALGLGERLGKNSPFRRALQRLCTFELARPAGPGSLAVRTTIPTLPLRHLARLPDPLQASHRRWQFEQRLPESERMRRRAARLASDLAAPGTGRRGIEAQLGAWQSHPAVAYRAAEQADTGQPGSRSWPAGVSPQ